MKTQEKLGIYCLANDKVLDWMIAFLKSLRTYEPSRKLIVIPFDENIEKLSRLANKYNSDPKSIELPNEQTSHPSIDSSHIYTSDSRLFCGSGCDTLVKNR